MCGRFVQDMESLIKKFQHLELESDLISNFNIAPSQEVPVIICEKDQKTLVKLHWGLVPFWAKDKSIGNRMINARIETIADKPAFRSAFKKRKCLIPACGYYEWKGKAGQKQPYYIYTGESFAFAGLWESWDKEDPPYRSFVIITTESSKSIQEIHDRMPVILKPEYHEKWLDPNSDDALSILQEGMVREFKYHPVSKRVNKAENNDKSLIDPIHL
jgi:putative SOS response-associated peptidase YedK